MYEYLLTEKKQTLILQLTNIERKIDGENKLKFKKKSTIGLLYYRLHDYEPAHDTIWGIVCDLYHLDFNNSEYDPLKDENIIKQLKKLEIEL